MGDGDMFQIRIPIIIDPDAPPDTKVIKAADVFAIPAFFDLVTSQIVPDKAKGGLNQVLVLINREELQT